MNLQIFKSSEQHITALAAKVVQCILQTPKQEIVIALSGGKSPIPVLEQLSHAKLDFSKVIFTLVDERIVETDNPDSNENLIRSHLLKNHAQAARFIGLSDLNKTPQQMVDHANTIIPPIDLAILGMGEDGHTASIFPDCSEIKPALDLHNPHKYILTNPISAKYSRISLTLAALNKIPQLILSINGNTKLSVLKESLRANNLNYPISYILSNKPTTEIYWSE